MKTKGTKVPLPHASTLKRWWDEGVARRLTFMFIVYDPLQQMHYPVYCKQGESIAKRFRSFYKDTSQIIVEAYPLSVPDPIAPLAPPRYRLESVARHREVLGLTWDEVGSHNRVLGRGNR